jgi:hypothetical protein
MPWAVIDRCQRPADGFDFSIETVDAPLPAPCKRGGAGTFGGHCHGALAGNVRATHLSCTDVPTTEPKRALAGTGGGQCHGAPNGAPSAWPFSRVTEVEFGGVFVGDLVPHDRVAIGGTGHLFEAATALEGRPRLREPLTHGAGVTGDLEVVVGL